ncbi:MAG: hypothetical protein TYPL_3690 [Candidatus Tyloplasma litorale]|nr:MAG: hypothetical protein TYPL_3690 [Mycoplasmatales bacterium]
MKKYKHLELKNFQIIEVKEHNVNIKYKDSKFKNPRPYLVVKNKISQNHFLAVPLTSVKTKDNNTKQKNRNWIKFSYTKESYIKLDQIVIFNINDLKNDDIKLMKYYLPLNKKPMAISILQRIFSYENKQNKK